VWFSKPKQQQQQQQQPVEAQISQQVHTKETKKLIRMWGKVRQVRQVTTEGTNQHRAITRPPSFFSLLPFLSFPFLSLSSSFFSLSSSSLSFSLVSRHEDFVAFVKRPGFPCRRHPAPDGTI
jgi:hypothetical protein